MVKQQIGTIAGAICGICTIVVIAVVSCAMWWRQVVHFCTPPTKKESTIFLHPNHKQTRKSAKRCLWQHQQVVMVSWRPLPWHRHATSVFAGVFSFLTPHPRKKTAGTGNLKFRCICASKYPSLVPECHLWRHFDWEGGGGDMGGAMVQQKGESWVLTGGTNVFPLKPIWWLQRADTSPTHKRGKICEYLPWGVAGISKKRYFCCCPHHHHFCCFCEKTTKLAVCCWVYFDPVTHSKTHPSPGHNSSYLWESTAKLLLDSWLP